MLSALLFHVKKKQASPTGLTDAPGFPLTTAKPATNIGKSWLGKKKKVFLNISSLILSFQAVQRYEWVWVNSTGKVLGHCENWLHHCQFCQRSSMTRDTVQSSISVLRCTKLWFVQRTDFSWVLCVLSALDARQPLQLGLVFSHFTDEGTKAKQDVQGHEKKEAELSWT